METNGAEIAFSSSLPSFYRTEAVRTSIGRSVLFARRARYPG
jgi:hypothetical protein